MAARVLSKRLTNRSASSSATESAANSKSTLKSVSALEQDSNTGPLAKTDKDFKFVEQLKRQWLETIDSLPDPLMVVSGDYKISRANAEVARIAGKPIKQIIGKTCYKIFAGRNSPCEGCHIALKSKQASTLTYQIDNQKNDRAYEVVTRNFDVKSQDADLLREDGSASSHHYLHLYRDRTDLVRMEQKLTHQEKLAGLGQLAGGFAHEINNPIGGILVFSQMLLREMSPSSQHFGDVQEIEAAAKRCKAIVEQMLEFARQRPIKSLKAIIDVHEIINASIKFAEIGHNPGRIHQVIANLNAKEYKIFGDSNRLMQVLLNLLINAFQACKKPSTIEINTDNTHYHGETWIQLRIKDQGQGISKENLNMIFNPFFTTKEPGQGTGLGLSVVHGIVEDLSGTITVERTSRKGTTFLVNIPVARSGGNT